CIISGKRHDPCVIDVFISAVHFMKGGKPLPWWSFTAERKKYLEKAKQSENKFMS
ncbi:MAG: helix-hairpin-helix domain-containing protein, partial [Smithella sp.]